MIKRASNLPILTFNNAMLWRWSPDKGTDIDDEAN
jgi:hypothetical protein